MTTIVFAGGGTGGHLFPGIAVAEELRGRDPSVRCLFVGSDRAIEKQILSQAGLEHRALASAPSSSFLRSPLRSAFRNWRAFRSARAILNETAPAAVIGLGGFASVPIILAAWRRRAPIVLLEQNAILGRANRILLPLADRICLSFANTPVPSRYRTRAHATGNPLRRALLPSLSEDPIERKCFLILGGSQGAGGVNEALIQAWPGLRNEVAGWRIVHQTGQRDFESIKAGYARLGIPADVSPFLSDLGSIYPRTALAVSRAGGTSLSELAVHGIPSILIPYPRSIRDHQLRNAQRFAEAGGAMVVEQAEDPSLTASRLADPLRQLLTRDDLRDRMGRALSSLAFPDAAGTVADLVLADCGTRKRAA